MSVSKIYQTFLRKFPILSQAVQAGALMGAGDFIAQTVVEKRPMKDYSLQRTAQFTSIGFFIAGPTLTVWYGFLAKRFGSVGGGSVALKKMACDQLLFAPCFIVVFLTALGLVQRKPLDSIQKDITRDYKDILITNYKLWPPVQLVNFCFVPLQYQVLLVQFVALVWNTYLSWKTQSSH
ncbi:PREDICTED: protein Mpv17 [Nicrophorus vespilloides]|uniref:Mitochondrial inner membrane protein Mpv17 n=1 Tax=Nicrophorus vespilloides TaxID=110193 RepID=A0ABM1M0A4_NICVS|nr:PREDICTED: protein Mpv17 [Nicrophorus vespilloides]